MKVDGGSPTASVDDHRLTRVGRFLRKTKLDELPTLWNLLRGDIAIVGPRPDVPSELEDLDPIVRQIVLSVKPGLVSPATLWNFNEDEFLKNEPEPHQAYLEKIKPIKYRLNTWYVQNKSWWLDLKVIFASILKFAKITIKCYPEELCRKDFDRTVQN